MALTPSNMLPLGTKAPSFNLHNVLTGENTSFEDVQGEHGTLVMFICNHCPYVIHLFRDLVDFTDEYKAKGLGVVAISSNDVENYKEDSPDKMAIVSKVLKFDFPYLYDEDQSVAKAYDAACTPDFYVFNKKNELVYRGRFDESRPNSGIEITGKDLRQAVDHMLNGEAVIEDQKPSMGCNIKWK